jgi:protein-tyrosine phosphatase
LSLAGHKGKQFTASLARQYDLILAMERSHIEQISRIAPEAEENNVIWSLDREKRYPDPYRKSDEAFASVYDLIEQAGKCWAEKLGA